LVHEKVIFNLADAVLDAGDALLQLRPGHITAVDPPSGWRLLA